MTDTATGIVRTVAALRDAVADWRKDGDTVGLVPTMGALHRGHLALVDASTGLCARTVATIFVNPTQFGAGEDLDRYPRREAEDVKLLAEHGCDLVFAPAVDAMYPQGFATTVHVAGVTEPMEGAHRPGHFDGVATVVAKLLLQALPDRAFFGEKDYQQLVTIRRMVRDLDVPVTIEGVAIVREDDGLALSSRNEYLTPEQRAVAPALHRTLVAVAAAVRGGAAIDGAAADGARALADAGFDPVDYVAVRAAADLAPLTALDRPARVLGAAYLGRTRLIDNVAVE
jgi:pantoate--beta-alanine ligase